MEKKTYFIKIQTSTDWHIQKIENGDDLLILKAWLTKIDNEASGVVKENDAPNP